MRTPDLLLAVALGALSALACSSDCASACDKARDCQGKIHDADCDKVCNAADDIADKGDCQDQLDAWMSCLDDADDTCHAYENECDDESDHFEDCVKKYCENRPNDSECDTLDHVQ